MRTKAMSKAMSKSILNTDTNMLYKFLNEIENDLSDTRVSQHMTDFLTSMQRQINLEIKLRNCGMACENCYYKHENGNCAAISGTCLTNGYGKSLDLCQKARETYVKTLYRTKEGQLNGTNTGLKQNTD